MDEKGNAGSIACLQGIKNPISVAKLVMEKTPHVMLVAKLTAKSDEDNVRTMIYLINMKI